MIQSKFQGSLNISISTNPGFPCFCVDSTPLPTPNSTRLQETWTRLFEEATKLKESGLKALDLCDYMSNEKDRSFHFGNGSSVIWRTLVFQIWRTNLSMVFSLPKLDPLIPTVLQDDDLVRNPHTSYTKFKRLLKRQWLFWESLRWFLFPWQNWTIWVGILTVSLLMASFASYGNDRFRHGYSTFSQSFWLGCGCVSRLSRGSVFWWDHQGGSSREIQECEAMKKTLVV